MRDDGRELSSDVESYQINGRWYVRITKARSISLDEEMRAKGFIREDIPLSNGRMGYRYRRTYP